MEQSGLSIRDRIKALNQGQSNEQSRFPNLPLNKLSSTKKEKNIERVITQPFETKEDEIYLSPTSNKPILRVITKAQDVPASQDENGQVTTESVHRIPSTSLSPVSSEQDENDDGNYVLMRPCIPINSQVLRNMEESDEKDSQRNDAENDSDYEPHASPSSYRVSKDLQLKILPVDEHEINHYATPRDLPIVHDHRDRTLIPENIGSRWKKARQTVSDRGLRTMVDMSRLTSRLPVETVTSERNVTKGLTDDSALENSTIPAMTANPKVQMKSTSSPGGLSPTNGSRNSSYKSSISRESANFSDASDTTSSMSDFGRPRNFSDVSVTNEEDQYISFGSVDDGINDPNEKVLIVVRGDKSYTQRLYLSPEDNKQSRVQSDAENEEASETQRSSREKKSKTGSKFKAVVKNKLAKAIRATKNASTSPTKNHRLSTDETSSKSLPTSPAKFTSSPTSRHNASADSKYSSNPSSPHHQLSYSSELSPKSEISHRFVGSYPRLPSTVSVTINKGTDDVSQSIYCEPNEIANSSDFASNEARNQPTMFCNDRSVEVDDHGNQEDSWYVTPLSSGNRSRSLANLRQDETSSQEIRRKSGCDFNSQSAKNDQDDNVYLESIRSPLLQTPTQKETYWSQNFGSSVTNNGESLVTLRSKTKNKENQFNATMPHPPAPRPLSMPPDAPPQVNINAVKAEDKLSTGSQVTSPRVRQVPSLNDSATSLHLAATTPGKNLATFSASDSSTEERESIYYSVDDRQDLAKSVNDNDRNRLTTSIKTASGNSHDTYSRDVIRLQKNGSPPPLPTKLKITPPSSTKRHSDSATESKQLNISNALELQNPVAPGESSEGTVPTTNQPIVATKSGFPQKPITFVRPSNKQPSEIEKEEGSGKSPKFPAKSRSVKELSKMLSIDINDSHSGTKEQPYESSRPAENETKSPLRHLPNSKSYSGQPVEDASKLQKHILRHHSSPAIHDTTTDSRLVASTSPHLPKQSEKRYSLDVATTQPRQRSMAKRPTTAPPPRPNVPPPPPPSASPKTSDYKKSKTPPPSRPAPPSTKDVRAAAERRRLCTLTEEEDREDEYHDTFIQGNAEVSNIYASIDEETFSEKTWAPTPTGQKSYWRNGSKKQDSKNNLKFITKMQGINPMRRKKKTPLMGDVPPIKHNEQALYVGIDDMEG